MHSSILLALWALLAFVLFKIAVYVQNERRHARNAKRLGCEKAPTTNFDPLGIKNVYRLLKADKEFRIPQYVKGRTDGACQKAGKVLGTFHQVRRSGRRVGAAPICSTYRDCSEYLDSKLLLAFYALRAYTLYYRPKMKANVYAQNVLGSPAIFTVEPKNIQTILATQFKDFGLGEVRNNSFYPLLGWGIVSPPC